MLLARQLRNPRAACRYRGEIIFEDRHFCFDITDLGPQLRAAAQLVKEALVAGAGERVDGLAIDLGARGVGGEFPAAKLTCSQDRKHQSLAESLGFDRGKPYAEHSGLRITLLELDGR